MNPVYITSTRRSIPNIYNIFINGYLIHISLIRFLSCLLLLNMLFDISHFFFVHNASASFMLWHDFPLPGRSIDRNGNTLSTKRNTIGHETNLCDVPLVASSSIKAETLNEFCWVILIPTGFLRLNQSPSKLSSLSKDHHHIIIIY